MAMRVAQPDAPKVLAIVQAGGKGSRMGVLTEQRAKPALPVAGTHRLIDIAMSNLVNSGITSVWVSVQYLAGTLDAHMQHGRPWDLDRSFGGFRRVVPEEAEASLQGGFASGNADDLFRIRKDIDAEDTDLVVILSADQIFTVDLRQVVAKHVQTGADCTLVTADVSRTEASNKAVVTIDATGKVTKIEEKPENPDRGTVSAEIMVFTKSALLDVLTQMAEETAPHADGGDSGLGDLAEKFLPRLVADGNVRAYPIDGYWRDMGRPASYLAAHRDLTRAKTDVFGDPQWPMRTLGVNRGPARVRDGADVYRSLIAAGCDIAGTVRDSTLGQGVIVRAGAVVEDSVIFDDCVIEKDAVVRTAIVDESVTVRSGVQVGQTPAATAARDKDIAVVGQHSIVRNDVAPGTQIEPFTTN